MTSDPPTGRDAPVPADAPAARRRGGRSARLAQRTARRPGGVAADAEFDAELAARALEIRKGEGDALVVACGALAREILALAEHSGFRGFDLTCLPALLHNRPERIPDAVRDKIRAARRAGYARVIVGYGDCGTGGALDRVCEEEGVDRLPGAHCYAFFSGVDAFARIAPDETTAFYLTDFLARQFDTLVWRGLGLDRAPELRDAYFGNYEKLVYLAQTEDPALDRAAEAGAKRLGLAYERRFTGYGDLGDALARVAPDPSATEAS